MAPVNIGICLNRERPHVAQGLLGDPFQHRINQNSAGTTLAEAAAEFRRVKRRAGTRGGVRSARPVTDWHGAGSYVRRRAWACSEFRSLLVAHSVPQKLPTGLSGLALPRPPFQIEACAMGAEHVTIDSSIE